MRCRVTTLILLILDVLAVRKRQESKRNVVEKEALLAGRDVLAAGQQYAPVWAQDTAYGSSKAGGPMDERYERSRLARPDETQDD